MRRAGFSISIPTLWLSALLLLFAAPSGAQSLEDPHARVTLVADRDMAAPGTEMWLGLQFRLEKGWHIYWVNPGDSGQPPRVKWELAEGFQAGEMLWPQPVRLGMPSVVDYGYEEDVLLLVPLGIGANVKAGPATLAANVNWLVCREICIPEKARAETSLEITSARQRGALARAALFDAARKRIPRRQPSNWKVTTKEEGNKFVLGVETGARIDKASFFPLVEEQIENAAAQTATPFARGVTLRLEKSRRLLKPIPKLRGVLILDGNAYEIAVPVTRGKWREPEEPRDLENTGRSCL